MDSSRIGPVIAEWLGIPVLDWNRITHPQLMKKALSDKTKARVMLVTILTGKEAQAARQH